MQYVAADNAVSVSTADFAFSEFICRCLSFREQNNTSFVSKRSLNFFYNLGGI